MSKEMLRSHSEGTLGQAGVWVSLGKFYIPSNSEILKFESVFQKCLQEKRNFSPR